MRNNLQNLKSKRWGIKFDIRKGVWFLLLISLMAACSAQPAPQASDLESIFPTAPAPGAEIPTLVPEAGSGSLDLPESENEFVFPEAGLGPLNFPEGINPLTGLPPAEDGLLNRRPILVKVENMPRERSRPQWGLTYADHVYEYYIEAGDTRFSALIYGQQPPQIGPIRSARHIDMQLIEMYGSLFVFGGAYPDLYDQLLSADFADRLIQEGPNTAPALSRYDPEGENLLMLNPSELDAVLQNYQIDNSRQNLDGLFFQQQIPAGGENAEKVYVRFSGAVYNRWDYDSESGRYLRFADAADDVNRTQEVYAQLTDRLNGQPIGADNVVILMAPYQSLSETADVFDVTLNGSGRAYIARSGQLFSAVWKRSAKEGVLSLEWDDGTPFPLQPGQTWFEVINDFSQIDNQSDQSAWRFTFLRP